MRVSSLCCIPQISRFLRRNNKTTSTTSELQSQPQPVANPQGVTRTQAPTADFNSTRTSGIPLKTFPRSSKMRGAIIEQVAGEPKVVDSLERPSPGPGQVLVKSLWTAMNPVDAYMSMTGLLILDWPFVIGVDASGVIVETTPDAESKYNLKVGSYVCGCTRLGMKSYATGQEYFLMDAAVTIPKPKNIDIVQAATLGVGIETAALAVFEGLKVDLDSITPGSPSKEKGQWVIVLGGASSVGGYAVQLLKVAGYNVVASCGKRSAATVGALGAETLDYSLSLDDQVKSILDVTDGNIVGIFDAVAGDDPKLAKELFKSSAYANADKKLFATTNDWSGITDFEGGKTYCVQLGPVGRETSDAAELNAALERFIPVLVGLVESGQVKTGEYEVIGGDGGFEKVVEAYKLKSGGGGGSKKVVVKVQDE